MESFGSSRSGQQTFWRLEQEHNTKSSKGRDETGHTEGKEQKARTTLTGSRGGGRAAPCPWEHRGVPSWTWRQYQPQDILCTKQSRRDSQIYCSSSHTRRIQAAQTTCLDGKGGEGRNARHAAGDPVLADGGNGLLVAGNFAERHGARMIFGGWKRGKKGWKKGRYMKGRKQGRWAWNLKVEGCSLLAALRNGDH